MVMIGIFVTIQTGCGYASVSPHRDVEWEPVSAVSLVLMDGTYADVIEECLKEFEEKNHIYCEVTRLGEDELRKAIRADAENEVGRYDICMVDSSWMAEYAKNGVLQDLGEYGYEPDDDIIPSTMDICYYDGKLYMVPYYGNVSVLLYNKRLVAAAGFPSGEIDSLDDLYEVCKYSGEHHNIGFLYRGDTPSDIVVDFLPFLLSYGGWVVDEHNNPTVNTTEFKSAMEYYLKLIDTGKNESRDDLILAITNQAGTAAIGWPGWFASEKNGTADFDAFIGRTDEDSPVYNAGVYGIWALGVTANSRNKEEAVQLIEYLMDPEVQRSTVEYGGIPCRRSILTDPDVLAKYPRYEAVYKALESGVYRPVMEEWHDFYTILGTEMKKIIKGRKTVDQGLEDAQNELEDMLAHSTGD